MKNVILIILLIAACLSSFTAEAFWPFTSKKQKSAPREDHTPLSTYEINYQSYYGDAVREAAADVYVICADCPRSSELHRTLKEIPLVINLGSDPTKWLHYRTHRLIPVSAAPVPTAVEKPVEQAPSYQVNELKKDKREATSDCSDMTVYFEFNSSAVSPEERKKLIEEIPGLKRSDITLAGYTCDIGGQQYNDRLALARARSVEAILEEHNVIPVKVYGKGKCCYVSESKPKNRRVEVICGKKQN